MALLGYILYWKPLESGLFNGLAILNECMLVFMGYQMYLFTDFVLEPETRYILGKCFLGFLYMNIAMNLVVLGYEIANRTLRWAKRRFVLFKHRLAVEYINQKRTRQIEVTKEETVTQTQVTE